MAIRRSMPRRRRQKSGKIASIYWWWAIRPRYSVDKVGTLKFYFYISEVTFRGIEARVEGGRLARLAGKAVGSSSWMSLGVGTDRTGRREGGKRIVGCGVEGRPARFDAGGCHRVREGREEGRKEKKEWAGKGEELSERCSAYCGGAGGNQSIVMAFHWRAGFLIVWEKFLRHEMTWLDAWYASVNFRPHGVRRLHTGEERRERSRLPDPR
ncbi:hypothetical protein K438DRAFT_1767409 [Mycena galopus ATCC 62051]|nr:hypothetical protein K438DRAFT_1767409 [Mycena galopus ATCC 62051]